MVFITLRVHCGRQRVEKGNNRFEILSSTLSIIETPEKKSFSSRAPLDILNEL
jgi:hypothetical protein